MHETEEAGNLCTLQSSFIKQKIVTVLCKSQESHALSLWSDSHNLPSW